MAEQLHFLIAIQQNGVRKASLYHGDSDLRNMPQRSRCTSVDLLVGD
jgi:hypothetical protein